MTTNPLIKLSNGVQGLSLKERAELFQATGKALGETEVGVLATDISRMMFGHIEALSEQEQIRNQLMKNESKLEKLEKDFIEMAVNASETPPPLS